MSAVVDDTFTDADDTDIESHVGEIGATWTRDAVFGQGNGGGRTFGIFSNKLRRLTFAEQPGADGGSSLIRPSGLLPGGTTHFTITVPFTYGAGGGVNATLEIYEQAINPGAGLLLCVIGQGSVTLAGTGGGTVGAGAGTLLLEVNGTALTLKLDGTTLLTSTRATQPAEPFGFSLFDGNSDGDVLLDRVTIEPVGPPAPFWTEYVKTTETTA